jgi:hypothetical protein
VSRSSRAGRRIRACIPGLRAARSRVSMACPKAHKMRTCALLLIGLGVGAASPAGPALAQAQRQAEPKPPVAAGPVSRGARAASSSRSRRQQPYEGVWGGDGTAACRDEDGVNRMEISGNRLYWYETRCRARTIEAKSRWSWTMRVSCEGEGKRFRARPRLSLATPDRLVMDDAPVGPTRRQVYVRCVGPLPNLR